MGNVGIRSTGPATSCDRNDDTVTPAPPESHGTHRTSGWTSECDRAERPGTDSASASEHHPDQAVPEAKRKVVTFQLPPSADDAHVSWLRLRYHEAVARVARTEWLRRTVPVLANALHAAGEVTPSNRTRRERSRRRAPYRVRPLARISRRRWHQQTLVSETQLLKTSWPVRQTEQLFLPTFPVDERRDRRYGNRVHVANGAFGRVFQVANPEQTSSRPSQYALKVYRKSDIVYSGAVQQLVDEVNIQTICGHHPFIVRCVDFWQSRTHIFLLSNYYGNGELFQRLKTFCSELSRLYVAELALAIDFLHNAGIIYRDLKPENILLDDDYHIKLIDFGLSKWLRIGGRTSTLCGTVQYMGKGGSPQKYDGIRLFVIG